jgi:hypothetical protein
MMERSKNPDPSSIRQKSITVHIHPLQLFPQTWQRRLEDLGLRDKGSGTFTSKDS